jgi:hypothetical protein
VQKSNGGGKYAHSGFLGKFSPLSELHLCLQSAGLEAVDPFKKWLPPRTEYHPILAYSYSRAPDTERSSMVSETTGGLSLQKGMGAYRKLYICTLLQLIHHKSYP